MKIKNAIRLTLSLLLVSILALAFTSCSKNYTITFNSDGGTPVASIEVEAGGFAKEPEAPTKEGYTFDGWYINNDKWSFDHYSCLNDMTLTAKWIKNYTASFDSQGAEAVAAQTLPEGSKLTPPTIPSKMNAEFLGWYLGDAKWDFASDTLTQDITLVAKWKAVYTVSFDSNGGTIINPQRVKDGDKAIEPTVPVKIGYRFDGWYAGDAKWNFNSAIIADTLLKAKWTPIYSVSFSTDGAGTVPTASVFGGSPVLKPADISKDGYVFDGWYFGDKLWDFKNDTVNANITLTARWKKIHTVSFIVDGVVFATEKVIDGELLKKPLDPAKPLYIFNGWVVDGAAWNFETGKVSKDMTLSPSWLDNYYIINFDTDGAGTIPPQYIEKGQKITPPKAPEKTDYVFAMWALGGARWDFNVVPTSNITLKAVWDVEYWEVKFDTKVDGITVPSQKVAKLYAKITEPEEIKRAGYYFIGWYYNDVRWDFENNLVTEAMGNITLSAAWVQTFTVKYNTACDITIPDQTYVKDALLSPPEISRPGYRFDGWYLGDVLWDFANGKINADLILTARWTVKYTVSFVLDGGTGIIPEQTVYGDGMYAVEPSVIPEKAGYRFDGWTIDYPVRFDFANTVITANITLRPIWRQGFTVKFDTNGGVGTYPDQTVYYGDGETAYMPFPAPTKENHVFKGWYLGDTLWDFNNEVSANIVLKAEWEPIKCTVSFDTSGSAPIDSVVLNYGAKVSKPETPIRGTNFTFHSWRYEVSENVWEIWDFENDTVTEDITLKAWWINHAPGSESGGTVGPFDENDILGPIDPLG